jgi:hypothetical protein
VLVVGRLIDWRDRRTTTTRLSAGRRVFFHVLYTLPPCPRAPVGAVTNPLWPGQRSFLLGPANAKMPIRERGSSESRTSPLRALPTDLRPWTAAQIAGYVRRGPLATAVVMCGSACVTRPPWRRTVRSPPLKACAGTVARQHRGRYRRFGSGEVVPRRRVPARARWRGRVPTRTIGLGTTLALVVLSWLDDAVGFTPVPSATMSAPEYMGGLAAVD